MNTQPFEQLGRYVLVDRIASGGMAHVHRAKLFGVEGFVKEVAIKKILPHWAENQDFVTMLIDEAKTLVHLNHANIVQVHELNKEEKTYFIVMEYIDGVDLRAFINQLNHTNQSLSLPLVCYITEQICLGLQYAHEKKDKFHHSLGIVHRDVSPQNILLSVEGEVKITDFGIAKIVGKSSETTVGTLKGKFSYMSPEQAMGEEVDCRTDIFSVGILVYEMVSGKRCFKGRNDLDTLESVRQAKYSFTDEDKVKIPVPLRNIIEKALQKDREARYQSIQELYQDIRQWEQLERFSITSLDLKYTIGDLFAEELKKKYKREEELTEKTKIHAQTLIDRQWTHPKTKILVGSSVLEEKTKLATVIDAAKTIILEKTVLFVSKLPQRIKTQVTLVTHSKWRKPLYWSLVTFMALAFYGILIVLKEGGPQLSRPLQQKTISKESVVEKSSDQKQINETEIKVSDDVVKEEAYQGEVELFINPKGSHVVVSQGDKKWTLDEEGKLNLKDLKDENTFVLSIENPGFIPLNESFQLTRTSPKFKKEISLEKALSGLLVVNAKPWGKVYLGGHINGVETPINQVKIPVGQYRLQVLFPPKNKSVFANVSIKENSVTKCQALFMDQAQISCR